MWNYCNSVIVAFEVFIFYWHKGLFVNVLKYDCFLSPVSHVKWDVFGMLAALPRYCTDGRRHSYGMLRLLPGGKELTDYGLLQKSDTSGKFYQGQVQRSSLALPVLRHRWLSAGMRVKCTLPNTNGSIYRWPEANTTIFRLSNTDTVCQIRIEISKR